MVYNELGLIQKSFVKFSQFGSALRNEVDSENSFGEIIHDGKLSWLAKGAHLEVFSLKDGQRICSFHFDSQDGFERSIITTVTEIECVNENCCFLAVGLQMHDSSGSIVAIYSVQGSKILRCIEISDRITCCVHVSEDITKRTFLQLMQGCLAIGTDAGKLILLDINFKKCEDALLEEGEDKLDWVPCHMVKSTLHLTHISDHYKHTLQENFNFGIELEQVGEESFVLSLLPLPSSLCLIAGLEDGRMIIYDMTELQLLNIVLPQEHLSPLSKMTYLQPQDDPRPIVYVWAFHENPETCFAVMHCLEYEKKIVDENDNIVLLEEFQKSYVKLVLSMYEKNSLPVRCQTITKFATNADDDSISICMLAWKTKAFTQLLIFDMNQWYREEMPEGGDWRENLTYLSPFRVKNMNSLDVYFDQNSVSHFNSVQRVEEHFYPISLTFDFAFLLPNANCALHWPGLQYRALDTLNTGGTIALFEPAPYFNEIKCASLIPQFYEKEMKKSQIPINTQREVLLSVALEYNCIGLLKNCARNWADGSYIGQRPNEGVSLSTLTDWIWKRAGVLKQRCNAICECLFDFSGHSVDPRSKKELFHLTRQLKILSNLLEIVLTNCKQHIPNHVFERLESELCSIRIASEYQDVLQWLLNIGLLPEGMPRGSTQQNTNRLFVPYPYKLLSDYYKAQRKRFAGINQDLIRARNNGCRLLYIDALIENKCNIDALKEQWQVEHGQAAYPPPSMQALLRTLLVPGVPLETKHALLIYVFLDLNMAVSEESYAGVVQSLIKFPAVFKLNASLIKSVQAFWNLDHGLFEVALEEIICPFLHEKKLEQWEQELLIESFLVQEHACLALRALQARSATVSPTLEIKVCVANDLISEAFHLARSKKNPDLMRTFIKCCQYVGKWDILRDLALNEEEEKIVEESLKESKRTQPENIYLMYMLQKSKYIEAKMYLDEMRTKINTRSNFIANAGNDFELSKSLLSAYNCTMTPLSKNLNEYYYGLRSKVAFANQLRDKNEEKTVTPFSSELLKNNKRSLLDGLFQSSILSIDGASNYWNEPNASMKREERMMQTNNVPFVRKPQLEPYTDLLANSDILAYPETFKEPKKRRLYSEEESIENNDLPDEDLVQDNRKKRIRLMQVEEFNSFGEANDRNQIKSNQQNDNKANSSIVPTKNLMITPVVGNCRFSAKQRLKDLTDNVLTPQSILKIKSLIRPNSPSVLKPVKISSSKPIEYEYMESENASEATENESEKSERVHPRIGETNLRNTSFDLYKTVYPETCFNNRNESVQHEQTLFGYKTALSETQFKDVDEQPDETISAYKTMREEPSFIDASEPQKSTTQNIDSENESIHIEKAISEPVSSTSKASAIYPEAKARKSIRDRNSSVLSTSASDFYSPAESANNTINYSAKDSDSEVQSNYDSPASQPAVTTKTTVEREISKDSGAVTSTSTSTFSWLGQTSNMQAKFSGPKSRRPLRRSETPPKQNVEDIQLRKKRVVHSEEMTDSDMLVRAPDKREIQPVTNVTFTNKQQNLGRIVAEKNFAKNLTPTSPQSIIFKEVTEYNSELYKTSTNEFKPMTSSSKVSHTVSKFTESTKVVKYSDQTTVVDEMSVMESTEESNFDNKKEINEEQAKPAECLMSTVEITNSSWIDNTKISPSCGETVESPSKTDKNEKLESISESSGNIDSENQNSDSKFLQLAETNEDEMMPVLEDEYECENEECEDDVEDDEINWEEAEEDNEDLDLNESTEQQEIEDIIDISSDSKSSSEATYSSKGECKTSTASTSSKGPDEIQEESYDIDYNLEDDVYNDMMDEMVYSKTTRAISLSSSLDSTLEVSNEDAELNKTEEAAVLHTIAEEEEMQEEKAEITENQNNNKQPETDHEDSQSEDSIATIPFVLKKSEMDDKTTSSNTSINIRSARAQSLNRDESSNDPASVTTERMNRATSEQPNNDLLEKVKKLDKKLTGSPTVSSPRTIMTRRRSRLLDRIDEENMLETPTKTARKRLDSTESVASESNFTLNVEGSPSPVKQTRRSSISSITEVQTPVKALTPRRMSRGASLANELTSLPEEQPSTPSRRITRRSSIQLDTPSETSSGKESNTNELAQTPRRRRLSVQKDTASEGTNKEEENTESALNPSKRRRNDAEIDDESKATQSPSKPTRRNSILVEPSEIILTPRRTRGGSSLREIVLTPRRSSRGASLAKEMTNEEPEKKVKDTPEKIRTRRTSQTESTSKNLFDANSTSESQNNDEDTNEANVSTEFDSNKITEDYSMERRLTRTQKSMLQKSANIKAADQSMIPLKKRQSRTQLDDSSETISPSKTDDTVSVKSGRSRRSTASKDHSIKQSKTKDQDKYDDDNDDLESTVSSLRSATSNRSPKKRRSTKGKLKSISEKDEEYQKGVSDAESNSTTYSGHRLRNRTKKAN